MMEELDSLNSNKVAVLMLLFMDFQLLHHLNINEHEWHEFR